MRDVMAELSRKIGIPVSISVGIAIYDRDGESFEKLYKAADEALYQVKRTGKNAISFFSSPTSLEERTGLLNKPTENEELLDTKGVYDEDIENE